MEDRFVEIPLTKGAVAIIDEADLHLLVPHSWRLTRDGYAASSVKQSFTLLHRRLLGLEKGDGKSVDHIDGDRLNNRRSNLRVCTHSENMRNQGKHTRNASGFKGVFWNKKDKRWQAEVAVLGKNYYAGYHATAELAAAARDRLAEQLHGEFFRPSVSK